MPKNNSSNVSVPTKNVSKAAQPKPAKKILEGDLKRKKPASEKSEGSKNQLKKGKQKKSDEIDEIFAALKKRKTEQAEAEKSGDLKDKIKKKKTSKVINENESLNSNSRPRRRTNDGFVIYSAEELGVDKRDAGETALCPFDCSCCF